MARALAEVQPALDALDAALASGHHVAGMLAYEAGAALVDGLAPGPTPDDVPLLWFGIYDAPRRLDAAALDADLAALPDARIRDLSVALTRAAYRARIARAHAHIRAGDVYQVNLTMPLRFRTDAQPLALYAALRRRQPVPYGAVLSLPGAAVLSVSPELFLRVDAGPDGHGAADEGDGAARRFTIRGRPPRR